MKVQNENVQQIVKQMDKINIDRKVQPEELTAFLSSKGESINEFYEIIKGDGFKKELLKAIPLEKSLKTLFGEQGLSLYSILSKDGKKISGKLRAIMEDEYKDVQGGNAKNENTEYRDFKLTKELQKILNNELNIVKEMYEKADTIEKKSALNLTLKLMLDDFIDIEEILEKDYFNKGFKESAALSSISYFDFAANPNAMNGTGYDILMNGQNIKSNNNKVQDKASIALADEYIVSKKYKVLDHINDINGSGFSATVFEDNISKTKTIAIRGTDNSKDFWADFNIFNGYGPQKQIMKMIDYIEGLKSKGLIKPDEKINITGHSLGGYLAQIGSVLFHENLNQCFVYNAPGSKDLGIFLIKLYKNKDNTFVTKYSKITKDYGKYIEKYLTFNDDNQINNKIHSVKVEGFDFVQSVGDALGSTQIQLKTPKRIEKIRGGKIHSINNCYELISNLNPAQYEDIYQLQKQSKSILAKNSVHQKMYVAQK